MPDNQDPQESKCPFGICGVETGNGCPRCTGDDERVYWCDVCKKSFSSKRCPQCGLKLKRIG